MSGHLAAVLAHPDDDTWGISGTVALHADDPGFRFTLVLATSGGDGVLDSNGCDVTQFIDNEWTDRNGRYVASIYKNVLLRYPSAAKPGHYIAIASQYRYTSSAGVAIAPVAGANAAGPAFALVPDAAVVPPPRRLRYTRAQWPEDWTGRQGAGRRSERWRQQPRIGWPSCATWRPRPGA